MTSKREDLGDMARRANARHPEWKPGDEVEFRHIVALASGLPELDQQMIGNVWNELGCAKGRLKVLEQEAKDREARSEEEAREADKGRKRRKRAAELELQAKVARLTDS